MGFAAERKKKVLCMQNTLKCLKQQKKNKINTITTFIYYIILSKQNGNSR